MATLKIHYNGWLALPGGLCQMLDLKTGDRLEVELVDGTIVLKPANGTRAPAKPKKAAELATVASAPAPSVETTTPAKRPRGRPRKVHATNTQPELMLGIADPLSSPKRKPGRPRIGRAEEASPATETAPQPLATEAALWKLRPKAELQAEKPDPVPLPLPPRRREASWTGGGYEREERRPFRHVEVRKLGPGRGHNRTWREVNSGGTG